MRWIDILSASLSNLLRRKLRSALTMLGVVIGSTAIIVTISLGYGAEKTQMETLQSSTNLKLISVTPYYGYSDQGSEDGRRVTKIDDNVIRQLRYLDNVDVVTPITHIYGNIYFTYNIGKLEAILYPVVADPKAIEKILSLKEGSFFSSRTERMEFLLTEEMMCTFIDPKKEDYVDYEPIWEAMDSGEDLPVPTGVDWLKDTFTVHMQWDDYEDYDPVTQEPKSYDKELKGSMKGILEPCLDGSLYSFQYGAVISQDYYKALMKANKKLFKDNDLPDLSEYNSVLVLADSVENVEKLVKDLREFGVAPSSPLETIRQMREQIRMMQLFMGFIGAISMFVAALSIANTMMMSIYERTREIGVMKVLGCKMGNIRLMFLCEAAYIGIIGGLAGIALSHLLSQALNTVPQLQEIVAQFMSSDSMTLAVGENTSIIPPELALTTFGFVVATSVLSGFYPAQRAMHLSSLAAIRAD